MQYKVIQEESEEGFAVSVPGLPGCHSQGATEQEALENAQSTKRRRTITHRAAMPQSDFLPCLVL